MTAAITMPSSAAVRVGRLIRVLSSPQPGEIVAAARALDRMLRAAGLDIHHLAFVAEQGLQRLPASSDSGRPHGASKNGSPDSHASIAEMIGFCARATYLLSEREIAFIQDLDRLLFSLRDALDLSERQQIWLRSIFHRLRRGTS